MLSLASLAGWEEAVLASIAGASGTTEERDRQIERSGVYGEYPAILSAYLELAADADAGLEAIKRAVFLVWRSAMSLPTESAIAELPEGMSRAAVHALDGVIRRGAGDDELAWMLAHYVADGRFVFELYGATPALFRHAESPEPERWRTTPITPALMARRGQLGRYWLDMAAASR